MQYAFLLFFMMTPLYADEQGSSYNFWSEFLHMLVMLAFVIGFIFLTVSILKKLMRSRIKSLNQANGIKILERRPLGPKSAIYLIEVLGKGLVVAESPSGISLLSELPENIALEEALNEQLEEKKSHPSFRDILAKKIQKQPQ